MSLVPDGLAAVLGPLSEDAAREMRRRTARGVVASFDRVDTIVSPRTIERIAHAWGERAYPKLARVLRHVGAA